MKYSIRRHLGRNKVLLPSGEKKSVYGFFQIRECIGKTKLGKVIAYVDGTKNTIEMSECYLHNSLSRSQHIFDGRNDGVYKERCAWIVAESYKITKLQEKTDVEVCFNPRICPHWTFMKIPCDGTNFEKMISVNYKIYQK